MTEIWNSLLAKLISQYPFHRMILGIIGAGAGTILRIPERNLSLLDQVLVLLLAGLIASGIASTLRHIFAPEDRRSGVRSLRGSVVTILSTVVTILFANMIFTSLVQHMTGTGLKSLLFFLMKIVIVILVLLVFVVFARSTASTLSGNGFGFGMFLGLVVWAVCKVVAADVVSVWILYQLMAV